MQRTIRQHYVPRLYLKQFATEIRDDIFQIYAYDLDDKRTFSQKIDNIALENKFYDLEIDDELLDLSQREEVLERLSKEKNACIPLELKEKILSTNSYISLEEGFAEVEANVAPALQSLIQNQNVRALSSWERTQISIFIGSLYIRTPKSKKQFFEAARKVSERINGLYPGMAKDLEYNEKKLKLIWLMQMEDSAKEIANLIYRMNWNLKFSKFGAEIHTSDNPLLLHNPTPPRPPYGNIGVAVPGTQIYLPITPYMLLEIKWEKPYLETEQFKYFDHKFALFIKSLLVGFAEKRLFARSQDVFDVQPGMKRNLIQMRID